MLTSSILQLWGAFHFRTGYDLSTSPHVGPMTYHESKQITLLSSPHLPNSGSLVKIHLPLIFTSQHSIQFSHYFYSLHNQHYLSYTHSNYTLQTPSLTPFSHINHYSKTSTITPQSPKNHPSTFTSPWPQKSSNLNQTKFNRFLISSPSQPIPPLPNFTPHSSPPPKNKLSVTSPSPSSTPFPDPYRYPTAKLKPLSYSPHSPHSNHTNHLTPKFRKP